MPRKLTKKYFPDSNGTYEYFYWGSSLNNREFVYTDDRYHGNAETKTNVDKWIRLPVFVHFVVDFDGL